MTSFPAAGPLGCRGVSQLVAAQRLLQFAIMNEHNKLNSMRIVVADDNRDTATGLAMLLQEAGFQVVATVFSGPAALQVLATMRPDVAILDIVMPGLDGCEVASQVNGWPQPRPRLIALSGLSRIWDRADAAAAGFAAHFSKPVPFNALRTLLESYAAAEGDDELGQAEESECLRRQ